MSISKRVANVVVVDTSSWIHYFNGGGDKEALEAALSAGNAKITPLVAAELLSGTLTTAKRAELELLIGDLLLVATPLEHWFRVGRLRAQLRGKGYSISTPDAHVAQAAIDSEDTLLSRDEIFRKIAKHAKLKLA